ncbi:NAD(P)-dependent alcohol dehydrogenase [Streptomyces coffeae]|uniref:NAD(P)-dependent alcohol dehydrogenase n=1 Tax=Streptomyces coffeae TaxID=621382 RepID=A0ABS1N7E0_9ACTN|nr:NAD(P)-dependent alcohol dehydrogenase [Streptomyces coffeae]MBL1095968.1 NAD(P)-dependent alcohol dehydrogenase [Streptomyces coffeae]
MLSASAAVLRAGDQPYTIEEVTLDQPADDQLVVRVTATGFCHTDAVARGPELADGLPMITGHEAAGVVEWVGPDASGIDVGDHVVLTFSYCGSCSQCSENHPAYCETFVERNLFGRFATGGSGATGSAGEPIMARWFGQSTFATRTIVDARSAVVVDRDLPLAMLAPLGCGIITGAGTVLNALGVRPGESLAIFGVGAVGLAALLAAKAVGVESIIAIDLHPSRLELAAELGASATVLGGDNDAVLEQVRKHAGQGTHYSIDTTGVPDVILSAIHSLRARGTCALVGLQVGDVVLQGTTLAGKQLVGVTEGDADPTSLIPHLIQLWRDGQFPFDRLIETFPFTAINEAEQAALTGRAVKPVLIMEQSG